MSSLQKTYTLAGNANAEYDVETFNMYPASIAPTSSLTYYAYTDSTGIYERVSADIPFIAKNQIVLFMYSENIFKMDEFTQKVRSIKNVRSADLVIPKKISFYINWLEKAILDSKKSSKLHLAYQTN